MASKDVATTTDNLPAGIGGDVDGLEDVGAGDVLLPVIKIDHKNGVFVDSLSNESFESIEAIMLGLVKGRILWPSKMEEETRFPICRSLDFEHGRPTDAFIEKDISGKYPSKVSGFDRSEVEVAIRESNTGPSADPDELLTCGDCNLKEWETMPGAKTPWCSEQFIFPILRITEDGGFAPAYITFQRSAMKACKAYISSFRQAKRPMYTVRTRIKAVHQKRGTVEYVTPEFTKLDQTDPTDWAEFSNNLADIREFLTTARVRDDVEGSTDDDDDDEPKARKPKPTKGKVIDANVVEDDDDEPDNEPEPAAASTDVDDDDDDDEEPF